MRPTDVLDRWKISKLVDLLNEGKFVKLPHQRPLTLKKNSSKRFIESALKNKLLQNFIFADLNSSYLSSNNEEDKIFFGEYLKKGKEYSIEDCQHRIASLQSIFDEHFVGEFDGKMDDFYNIEVPVLILKNRSRNELISDFGEVNSGKTVTNDNLMWGIDNFINNFVKNKFINDEKFLRLYNIKTNSDNVKRILYGNILKIIKVCSYYDGIIESPNTNSNSMMSFIKSNISFLDETINLFDLWYNHIKNNETKNSFTTQSDLFFIIHILNKKNVEISSEKINNILVNLTDTRSSAEKRYNNILNLIGNEKL